MIKTVTLYEQKIAHELDINIHVERRNREREINE